MAVMIIIIILCVIAIVVVLTGVIMGGYASKRGMVLKSLNKYVLASEKEMEERIDECGNALRERVDREYVLTSRDGIELHGYLVRAASPSNKYVLCSHSYRSRLAAFEFGEVAPVWLSRGYNVFLVDHRAHGKSGGEYISFGQYESVDCVDWLNFMRREFGEDILIALHGQSMGAATVMIMSGMEELPANVKCIIEDSGYTTFYAQLRLMMPGPQWFRTILLWPMTVYLRIFHRIDIKKADALAAVRKARVPILFVHGAADAFVPPWMNEKLFNACTGEKERLICPNATHIKSIDYDPELYKQTVTAFAEKYLPGGSESPDMSASSPDVGS